MQGQQNNDRMQIDENPEYDAFVPMDVDAEVIPSNANVSLSTIFFNTNLDDFTKNIANKLLKVVDYIHCKAFGQNTGITLQGNQFVYDTFPPIHPQFTIPTGSNPCLVLLHEVKEDTLNIIMIAMLSFFYNNDQSKKCMDIWSVAKNPHYDFKNAFQTLLENIKKDNTFQDISQFNLYVSSDQTTRMTEQGRLRLYMSLGFEVLWGSSLEMIYPPGEYKVIRHKENKPEILLLENSTTHTRIYTYIGNVKGNTDNNIIMVAFPNALSIKRDVYYGCEDAFKGKKCIFFNGTTKKFYQDDFLPELPLKNNANVDIKPFVTKDHLYYFVRSLYHMGLTKILLKNTTIKEKYPTLRMNNFIDFVDVPPDFLVFTIMSPGSILKAVHKDEINNYVTSICKELINDDTTFNIEALQKLMELHRSNARFPLINIQSHKNIMKNFTEPVYNQQDKVNEPLSERQIMRSLLNSVTIENLGRQPIVEIETDDKFEDGKPIKKYQLDLQIYTPGMRMLNYQMSRATNTLRNLPAKNKNQAAKDDTYQMGTMYLDIDSKDQMKYIPITDDLDYVNKDDTPSLEEYFDYLRGTIQLPTIAGKKPMYFLFLFGCSSVLEENEYETLYELSHRRSIVYRLPKNTRIDSEEFLDTFVFQKQLLTEYECAPVAANAGGRRTRKQKQKRRSTKKNQSK